jgi:hypothetical protein
MKNITYFLASWSGPRICPDNYLKKHFKQLNKLKHNLSEVILGYPENPNEDPEYTDFVKSLKYLSNGTPITVMPCENNGRSYGQLDQAFNRFSDRIDYLIFIEDDYVPVLDNFDKIMTEMFEIKKQKRKCGFLCQCAKSWCGYPYHAAISNGITDKESLKKVKERFGFIPHDKKGYVNGQVDFSRSFIKAGMSLEDMSERFKAPYWTSTSVVEHAPKASDEYIIVPIQMLPTRKLKIL